MNPERLRAKIIEIEQERDAFVVEAQKQVDQQLAWFAGRIEQLNRLVAELGAELHAESGNVPSSPPPDTQKGHREP